MKGVNCNSTLAECVNSIVLIESESDTHLPSFIRWSIKANRMTVSDRTKPILSPVNVLTAYQRVLYLSPEATQLDPFNFGWFGSNFTQNPPLAPFAYARHIRLESNPQLCTHVKNKHLEEIYLRPSAVREVHSPVYEANFARNLPKPLRSRSNWCILVYTHTSRLLSTQYEYTWPKLFNSSIFVLLSIVLRANERFLLEIFS